MDIRVSTKAANAMINTLSGMLDGGRMCIYSGPMPSSPDDVAEAGKLLVEIPIPSLAFKESDGRVAHSFPFGKGIPAAKEGQMSWFRAVTAEGESVLVGDVGTTSESALVMPALHVSPGVIVELDGWELRLPL